MMKSGKNLVLGMAEGYDYQLIKPFVASLQRVRSNSDLVFFSSSVLLKKALRKYPWIEVLDFRPFLENVSGYDQLSPNVFRYYVYQKFLEARTDQYDQVLLADTRDVVFQDDPFSNGLEEGKSLHVFLETGNVPIKDQKDNRDWMTNCYGESILEVLGSEPISCSGVTLGTYQGIRELMDLMCAEFDNHTKKGIGLTGGEDQGVHNYLIHTGKLPQVRICGDEESEVVTVAYFKENTKVVKRKVVDDSGRIIPVVHQYDRNAELRRMFYWDLYGPSYILKIIRLRLGI